MDTNSYLNSMGKFSAEQKNGFEQIRASSEQNQFWILAKTWDKKMWDNIKSTWDYDFLMPKAMEKIWRNFLQTSFELRPSYCRRIIDTTKSDEIMAPLYQCKYAGIFDCA